MKSFLIFLSILVLYFVAEAGNDRSECTTMCANSFNGSDIAACYSKCRSSTSYYDSLKSAGNSEDASEASAFSNMPQQNGVPSEIGRCGPDGVDLGNACTPKSSYCTSLKCTMGNCTGCEGYSQQSATDPANDPKCVKTDSGYMCDPRNTPQAGKKECDEEAAASGNCSLGGAVSRQGDESVKGGCVGPGLEQQADGSCKNMITGEVTPANKEDSGSGSMYTCAQANQEVKEACDSEKKSWMTGINDVVRTLGPAVNQINPSTCGGIAAAQSGAQGSLATFAVMCNSALKKCTETCTNLPADSTMLTECKKMGTKSEQAQQQMASAMVTLRGSVASCQNAFGDLNQQAQAYCASNPSACAFNLPGGVQASVAGADQAGGSLPNPGLGSQGSGSAGTGAKGLDLNALGGDDGEGIGKINPSKAGEDPGGAKGGGHVAGGSGGGGGGDAGGGRGGKKEGGILSNILSGFFGSGGSGGGGGGGFLKKFFGGDKSDAYAANNPKKAAGPDLRQFLPGGLHDPNRNRGIAGQFIGRDGMSGPHSDIWKNINNRYQYKRASLLP